MKNILYIFGILTIGTIGFWGGFSATEKLSKIKSDSQKAQVVDTMKSDKKTTPPSKTKETTISFVGDMMLTRGVGNSVKNNFGNDFNRLFENISEIKNADILFANLEGPVSDIGNNVGSKYSFRMDPSVIPAIKDAGIDIVSFANNHVGDWNVNAFKDTLTRLDSANILKTGAGKNKAEAEEPTIIEKNDVKFGFLGLSDVGPVWMKAKENSPGILLANDPLIREIIKNAKEKSDVLIVSIHWGEEYKTVHNSHQQELARMIIDSGADVVIGHHPHVIQDIETYKDKPIVYSLGNFIFDQYFSRNTMKGMIFNITFDGDNIKNTESKIITLNKKFQPEGIFTEEEVREKEESISLVCPKPDKDYEDMSFLPIGQDIGLPDKTYIPNNLRELNEKSSTKGGICLTKEARDSFEAMTKQAEEDGYIIKASSGFRNYETQKFILANAIKKGNVNATIAVAKAGHSEHQLGIAVDITGQSIKYDSASDRFDKSEEAKWIEKNAGNYGFVISYPKGKEDITGYMYEPWHYRYVGVEIAKEIIESEKTINEYLSVL